jgi:hypothetical protein
MLCNIMPCISVEFYHIRHARTPAIRRLRAERTHLMQTCSLVVILGLIFEYGGEMKCLWTYTGLHGGITQNVVALIATSVRTHYKAQAMWPFSPIHFEKGDPKF